MIEQSVERHIRKNGNQEKRIVFLLLKPAQCKICCEVQITNSPPVNISTLKQANIAPKKQTKEANE